MHPVSDCDLVDMVARFLAIANARYGNVAVKERAAMAANALQELQQRRISEQTQK